MSKTEILHELYLRCKEIDFTDSHELAKNAETEEESDFIRLVSEFVLQQK